MSSDVAIKIDGLGKCYQIYRQPQDRLKQAIFPRFRKALRKTPKQYAKDFWALRDVSFEICKGETVGIIGRNGCGKSTLLQLICGTLSPTTGTVEVAGRIAALLELGSGFNPEFTGRENVFLNASILGATNGDIVKRFDEIAAFADIGDFIDQPVKRYSSGMVVRLAFAVAISVEPQILVVDEALAVGDEVFQRKCFAKIAAIKKAGATILFVSHAGSTIIELCDRAIFLEAGKFVTSGTPKDIVGLYQRYIYADPSVRKQMLEGVFCIDASSPELTLQRNNSEKDQQRSLDYFDKGLLKVEPFEYVSHGVRISDPLIVNEKGDMVNCLMRGKRYTYRYTVQFEKQATGLRFGMLIKTKTGLELGGAQTSIRMENFLSPVGAGRRANVEFLFECNLSPGVYFLNAGVLGSTEGAGDTYLHRLLDAYAFRVQPELDYLGTANVDFKCEPNIVLS